MISMMLCSRMALDSHVSLSGRTSNKLLKESSLQTSNTYDASSRFAAMIPACWITENDQANGAQNFKKFALTGPDSLRVFTGLAVLFAASDSATT